VSDVNKALKEAVSKIVIDPEAGSLTIHWHHADESSRGVLVFRQAIRQGLRKTLFSSAADKTTGVP
jgi:hypothetical protein